MSPGLSRKFYEGKNLCRQKDIRLLKAIASEARFGTGLSSYSRNQGGFPGENFNFRDSEEF